MIDNRIWNDSWFFGLGKESKLVFIFLLTNEACNLIGAYELPLRVVCSYLGMTQPQAEKALAELSDKVIYQNGWIIIRNYQKYNLMRNPSIEVSKKKQIDSLPEVIRELMTGCGQGVDTLVAPYKEKEKEREKKGGVGGNKPSPELMSKIAEDYQVPVSFVESKWEDVVQYCGSTGKHYRDYYLTLRNWVKKDSLNEKKGSYGRKVAVIPVR